MRTNNQTAVVSIVVKYVDTLMREGEGRGPPSIFSFVLLHVKWRDAKILANLKDTK